MNSRINNKVKDIKLWLGKFDPDYNRYIIIWVSLLPVYYIINLLYIKTILVANVDFFYKIHSCIAILSHCIILFIVIGWLLYLIIKNKTLLYKSIALTISLMLIFSFTVFDIIVYNIYTFHINGFIISELMQPDFFESSGISKKMIFVTIFEGLVILIIFYAIVRVLLSSRWEKLNRRISKINMKTVVLYVAIVAIVVEKIIMLFTSYSRPPYVYKLSRSIPFVYFNPVVHLQSVIKIDGIKDQKEAFGELIGNYKDFEYPLPTAMGKFKNRYNIVILSIESTRSEFFNKRLTPELSGFVNNSGVMKNNHYSGSNSTHLGLFSLIYSMNPFYHVYIKTQKIPSFPLTVLRKNNYITSFYSSTSLQWHRMDFFIEQSFDEVYVPRETSGDNVVLRDQMVTKKILEDIDSFSTRKRLIMAHYASTHYPFYFPREMALNKPYLDEPFDKKNYLFLEKIKPKLLNSFYNSLLFLDGEISLILKKLTKTGHINDTIIIITSDHGCEFGEDGHFFYSSTLSNYQTRVPLVILMPKKIRKNINSLPSDHMDIFPTIFHEMGYNGDLSNLQGHPIINSEFLNKYCIVAYQEVFEPKQFSIINKDYKLLVDYDDPTFVTGMTDLNDNAVKNIPDKKKRIQYLFDSIHFFRNKEQKKNKENVEGNLK